MFEEKFMKFEMEELLFEKKFESFQYWIYVRNMVYNKILEIKNNYGQAHTDLSNVSELKKTLIKAKNMKYWFTHSSIFNLSQKDILVINHQRRVKKGSVYECIYTDSFLKKLKYSYSVFESPTIDEKHYSPINTENIRYLDDINMIVRLKKQFYKNILKFKLDKNTREYLKDITNKINILFEIELNENYLENLIETQYLYYISGKKYYEKIIDKTQPKVIIEVVSYIFSRFILNEIAKERGIKIIELQHGIMNKEHIAYNFYENIELNQLPDYYFVFGDIWRNSSKLPVSQEKVRVVG